MNQFAGIQIDEGQDPELMLLIAQELKRRIAIEAVIAEQEQLELAQIYAALPNQRAIDGVGPQILAVAPTMYLHLKVTEQFDFKSTKDKKWLTQRYPEMKCPGKQTVKDTFAVGAPEAPPVRNTLQNPEILSQPRRNVRETVNFNQN